ncbi:hypothetical protein [Polymorphum gilvum]|uniref:Uncharacterized protein n=1 Tax=Polymorphum gilvum (strain LMG 25793 / CGMCC 1.9160 / SL003B-26A1) TaxID=991905 RepID=F2J255_POLGS|nr:hypothetical protein [Polymorphum gilvum]ADZ68814.1 hypothetical protein SL003B_0379 [Polymorphum gilvum SL003B-26A1]
MGETGMVELVRRLGALGLAVLGVAGGLSFLSPVTGLLCLAAAVALYAALPKPKPPTGAVQPDWRPSLLVSDLIGFAVGVPLVSLALLGAALTPGGGSLLLLLFLIPAALAFVIFVIGARQATSWIRFFGNGFEATEFGRSHRVRYADLASVRIRLWTLPGGIAWLVGALGRPDGIAFHSGARSSKTLVFTRRDGSVFVISSEVIPDLERVLVDMDRAGIDLPAGLSERGRKSIRKVREKRYGKVEEPLPPARSPFQRG